MNLTCPKCRARAVIPDDRVPAGGAWARCPQCAEKFFIQPAGWNHVVEQLASVPDKAPVRGPRTAEVQEMINRLKGSQAEEEAAAQDLSYITVYPAPARSFTPYLVVLLLLAASAVMLPLLFFNSAGERAVITQPSPRPAGAVKAYGEVELREDLLTLRRRFRRQANLNYHVDHSGAESRMYKYLLARLTPGQCQEIRRIQFNSSRPDQGFTAEAACLESGFASPLLHVQWRQGQAVIRFEGSDERMTLEMFPASSGASDS